MNNTKANYFVRKLHQINFFKTESKLSFLEKHKISFKLNSVAARKETENIIIKLGP